MTAIIVLLSLFSLLLIWQFVGYPVLMGLIAVLAKQSSKTCDYRHFVSVVVPAYNEAKVIEARIENLRGLDYPEDKFEIIVVESGSVDGTYEIVQSIIERDSISPKFLRIIKEEDRRGKASAINLGKSHAKGDIVLVTDANAVFDKNVLKEITPSGMV